MGEHEKAGLWAFVQELNRAWTVEGKPERLADYFAPEMIALSPTDRVRYESGKACVAAWTDFVRTTKILRWTEKNPLIVMLAEGRSAVVAYDFDIDYTVGAQRMKMSGRDLMTLERREGRWWLVADHFSPTPGSAPHRG